MVGRFDHKDWIVMGIESEGLSIWVKQSDDPCDYTDLNDPYRIGPGSDSIVVLNPRDREVVRSLSLGESLALDRVEEYTVRDDDDAQMKCPQHRDYFKDEIRHATSEKGTFYCHFV